MTQHTHVHQPPLLLNADVGEGLNTDDGLFPYLDQASIACGGHAGDAESMRRAVEACIDNMVMIGAHPSYPDLENFGRASMRIDAVALDQSLLKQIASLESVCDDAGAKLSYIKFHGALYNDIARDFKLFERMATLVANYSLPLDLMLSATALTASHFAAAEQLGIKLIAEAFADRLYALNGSLTARTCQTAVHQDAALILAQARSLASSQTVTTGTGEPLQVIASSVCLHGDNPASVQAVQLLRAALHG